MNAISLRSFVLAACLGTGLLAAQQPAFEVATIKPADLNARITMIGISYTDDGIDAHFVTIAMLLRGAYARLRYPLDDQIVGLPAWAESERFNIQARVSEADSAALKKLPQDERFDRIGLMIQSLLAERFNLKLHTGTKQAAVYEMVVAKGGLKIQPDTTVEEAVTPDGKPKMRGSFVNFAQDGIMVHKYSMVNLAGFLTVQKEVSRLVIDKTALSGLYSFKLDWSPNITMINGHIDTPPVGASDGPSIFTALQAVGLKLQPSTGTLDTLIVDHVDKPSAN